MLRNQKSLEEEKSQDVNVEKEKAKAKLDEFASKSKYGNSFMKFAHNLKARFHHEKHKDKPVQERELQEIINSPRPRK